MYDIITQKRIRHVQKRAQQRYGIRITSNDFYRIAIEIQTNRAVKIRPKKEIWGLRFKGKFIFVGYDKKREEVKTLLTQKMLEIKKEKRKIQFQKIIVNKERIKEIKQEIHQERMEKEKIRQERMPKYTYEEARNLMIQKNIQNLREYIELRREYLRLPRDPWRTYKGKGWNSRYEFFRKENIPLKM